MPKFLNILKRLSEKTFANFPGHLCSDGIEFDNGWSVRLSNWNPWNTVYNAAHFSKWLLRRASNAKYFLGALTFAYQFETGGASSTVDSDYLLQNRQNFRPLLPQHFYNTSANTLWVIPQEKVLSSAEYCLFGMMVFGFAAISLSFCVNVVGPALADHPIIDGDNRERKQIGLNRIEIKFPNQNPEKNIEERLNELKNRCEGHQDLLEAIQKFEKRYQCPVSREAMNNPITLPSGLTFDSSSLLNWFSLGHSNCPITKQNVGTKTLNPSFKIKELLEEDLSALEKIIDQKLRISVPGNAPYRCRRTYGY